MHCPMIQIAQIIRPVLRAAGGGQWATASRCRRVHARERRVVNLHDQPLKKRPIPPSFMSVEKVLVIVL